MNNEQVQQLINEKIDNKKKLYDELMDEFKEKLINKISEMLNYYKENSYIPQIKDFILTEMTKLKNISKYKIILNNIIDNCININDDNLINEMFESQIELNKNIDFSYLIDKIKVEFLKNIKLTDDIKQEMIGVIKNIINSFEDNIHEQNLRVINEFMEIYNKIRLSNNYYSKISKMEPNDAINFLNDEFNKMSENEFSKTLQELLNSDIAPEIRQFLTEKEKSKVM